MDDSSAADDAAPRHFGRLELMTVDHDPAASEPPRVRIAQYADAQQLQLWLPAQPAGWTRLGLCDDDGREVWAQPVPGAAARGQCLALDTAGWPPGDWCLRIERGDGQALRLRLRKAADDAPPRLPQPAAAADAGDDLRLRDGLQAALARRLGRRVRYESQGRCGRVVYHEPGVGGGFELAFDYELGGDEVPAWIAVPRPADWERDTGVAAARRDEILGFVAACVQRDQARTWVAEVTDSAIVLRPPRPGASR